MTRYTKNTGIDAHTPRGARLGALIGFVAVVTLLATLAWAGRHVALREIAALWIVSDTPVPVDAAAVFNGGLEYRPFAAAELYRRGLVSKIMVSNTRTSPAERLGVVHSYLRNNL